MTFAEWLDIMGWELTSHSPLEAKRDWTIITQLDAEGKSYGIKIKKRNFPHNGYFTYSETFTYGSIKQVETILERISDIETQLYLMSKQKS